MFLTESIPRKISYTLDEDEEDELDDNKENNNQHNGRETKESTEDIGFEKAIRTRNANKAAGRNNEDTLKKNQSKLLDEKLKELRKRLDKDEIQMGAKK